jgi:hypothetical protein
VLNSTITYEHKVKSSLSICPCPNHELTPSASYTKYSIIPRSKVSHSQPFSHLSADVVLNSLHSLNYKLTDEKSLSCHRASHQIDRLQVLLPSHSIIAWKCITKLAQSQPESASLNSLNLGFQLHLQTRLIMASECISEFSHTRSPIAFRNSLDHGLKVLLRVHSTWATQ